MRAFVLYAHPCEDSYNAAVHNVVISALNERGWQVDDCDLNAEGFQPVLTKEERTGYHTIPDNILPVKDYVDRLRAAEALIMIYPVWNYGPPAILKGFLDRVFLPDVSFKLHNGGVYPGMKHIKRLAFCTTYGGSRFRTILNADPPRKVAMRAIRYACGVPPTRYIALHDMNNNGPDKLNAHLERVKSEILKL